MSQILADLKKDYIELAGADPRISKKIQRLKVASRHGLLEGIVSESELNIMLDFLNGDRMAAFATSDKLNDITKLGLQMPKRTKEVNMSERG